MAGAAHFLPDQLEEESNDRVWYISLWCFNIFLIEVLNCLKPVSSGSIYAVLKQNIQWETNFATNLFRIIIMVTLMSLYGLRECHFIRTCNSLPCLFDRQLRDHLLDIVQTFVIQKFFFLQITLTTDCLTMDGKPSQPCYIKVVYILTEMQC